MVLLPYRFTLFSNRLLVDEKSEEVLLPYRFTLFSNLTTAIWSGKKVLLPYRFTLFSNPKDFIFTVPKFYYLIDLHYSQTSN